jgi:hypothetical protein
MQLCFVSVHGPRETYFVDEPRIIEFADISTTVEDFVNLPFFVTVLSENIP